MRILYIEGLFFTSSSVLGYEGCILAIGCYHLCIAGDSRSHLAHRFNFSYLGQCFAIFTDNEVCTIADTEEVICRSIGCEICVRE